MKHGSLFSGIGGFDLAAEWMGWENVFHCEWNEFGQKILKHYWPNAISYGDITKTDFTIHRGNIDIITGGFPCQPYSLAGKRKGKEDERHLWPEMLRAIREIQPCWVVGENVPGIINWSGGLVFHEVQTDLETEGYEVFPVVLPACSVNAPHRRDRTWFIAHSNSIRWEEIQSENDNIKKCNIQNNKRSSVHVGPCFALFDEERERLYESGICGTNDGVSKRMDRLTALGNAIVPQIALMIFRAIADYENI
jgi:DNA (cytosine-5)-methyltransferase 1